MLMSAYAMLAPRVSLIVCVYVDRYRIQKKITCVYSENICIPKCFLTGFISVKRNISIHLFFFLSGMFPFYFNGSMHSS